MAELTREALFKNPIDRTKMEEEAAADINPKDVPLMKPSWELDEDKKALTEPSNPGHYLALWLQKLSEKLNVTYDKDKIFDDRLFFQHPLFASRWFSMPYIGEIYFPSNKNMCQNIPITPVPGAKSKKGETNPIIWYNYNTTSHWDAGDASAPGQYPPLLGLKRGLRNEIVQKVFQNYLIAANKRLIKNWIGVIKYFYNSFDDEDKKKLYDWFQKDEARQHFRGWSQQLGKQIGYRPPNQKGHTAGKANDINYEMNPWCPLYNQSDAKMIGEKNEEDKLNAGGRIYDRALRLFVPLTETENGKLPEKENEKTNNSIRYFSERYYRNHFDWTQDTPTDTKPARQIAPFSADQVYGFYQILNWSLRFYFDLVYDRLKNNRDHDKTDGNLNSFHDDKDARSVDQFMLVLDDILKKENASICPSSEFLIEETIFEEVNKSVKKGKDAAAVKEFDEIIKTFNDGNKIEQIIYPFEKGKKYTRYRFKFLSLNADGISTNKKLLIVSYIRKQILDDHKKLSECIVYTTTTRDPCNGIFNYSYETFLALCYLPKDLLHLRAFGGFVSSFAGDMQHWDYDYEFRKNKDGKAPIVFISPVKDMKWDIGTTRKIEWAIYGGSSNVVVQYLKNGKEPEKGMETILKQIPTVAESVASTDWAIPSNYEADTGAVIKITAKNSNNEDVTLKSNPFTLIKGRITSPAQDAKWNIGTTQTIEWAIFGGVTDTVVGYLIGGLEKSEKPVTTISEPTISSASFGWNIPTDYKADAKAIIKITATDSEGKKITIKSDPFTLVK